MDITKYIGLLGLGSESTMYYYRRFNEKFNEMHGGFSTCPLKVLNTDFNMINPFLPNDYKNLEPVTENCLRELSNLVVDCIVVSNITLHETIDRLNSNSSLSDVIHPVDETIHLLLDDKVDEILLLGTMYSMNSEYLFQKFKHKQIRVIRPSHEEQVEVDQLRRDIYEGVESDEQIQQFQSLCSNYGRQTAIVLACTELSLIAEQVEVPVYDMANIQMNKAVQLLAEKN